MSSNIPVRLILSSTTLVELVKSITVQSLISYSLFYSVYLIFSFLSLCPAEFCRIHRSKGVRFFSISAAKHDSCVLFSISVVKLHDPRAYRNMNLTRQRFSFNFNPRDMLLSLQINFSLVSAAVACAIHERTSGFKPSSETTAPR